MKKEKLKNDYKILFPRTATDEDRRRRLIRRP